MTKKLDPAIGKILKEYGFGAEACWDCHGTWVVYHRVLEQVAAKANVVFDQPFVMEANGQQKCAAVCVTGHLGDRVEWSIGEAAPGNNKNAYPFAMAEKRGKDRVVLKLIGLHGLVYSEEEADDFKNQGRAPAASSGAITPVAAPKGAAPLTARSAIAALHTMGSPEMLKTWGEAHSDVIAELPEHDQEKIREAYTARLTAVSEAPVAAQ